MKKYTTTKDVVEMFYRDTTYMVAPYNEKTYNILKEGIIDKDTDRIIDKISDEFDATKLGQSPSMQVVKKIGLIIVDDVIEYESVFDAYILILVDVEKSREMRN